MTVGRPAAQWHRLAWQLPSAAFAVASGAAVVLLWW